jgi:hypothetical protein
MGEGNDPIGNHLWCKFCAYTDSLFAIKQT